MNEMTIYDKVALKMIPSLIDSYKDHEIQPSVESIIDDAYRWANAFVKKKEQTDKKMDKGKTDIKFGDVEWQPDHYGDCQRNNR